jgi:hypothetical protein
MPPTKESEHIELTHESAIIEPTAKKSKAWQKLDPPYNPMGMMILNNAKRGMEYQGETGAGNKRAARMQEAIEDYQKVMGADED